MVGWFDHLLNFLGDYNSSYRQSGISKASKIWLSWMWCKGIESNVDECKHKKWGDHNCNHDEDVSIRCYGMCLNYFV